MGRRNGATAERVVEVVFRLRVRLTRQNRHGVVVIIAVRGKGSSTATATPFPSSSFRSSTRLHQQRLETIQAMHRMLHANEERQLRPPTVACTVVGRRVIVGRAIVGRGRIIVGRRAASLPRQISNA
jgi:hypothetical protein